MSVIYLRRSGIQCTEEAVKNVKEKYSIDLNDLTVGTTGYIFDEHGNKSKIVVNEDSISITEESQVDEKDVEFEDVEILPCPFCGSDEIEIVSNHKSAIGGTVITTQLVCSGCGSSSAKLEDVVADDDEIMDNINSLERDVADLWNSRVDVEDVKIQREIEQNIDEVKDVLNDIVDSGSKLFNEIFSEENIDSAKKDFDKMASEIKESLKEKAQDAKERVKRRKREIELDIILDEMFGKGVRW
jgi:outer membrane murein-binding lipoprotein Lpp